MDFRLFGGALAICCASLSAHAGVNLRLTSGTFDPTQIVAGGEIPDNRIWVVQFKSAPDERARQMLEASKVEILGYLPDDAYVVRGESLSKVRIEVLPTVRSVVAYRPEWKMSTALPPLSVFSDLQAEFLMIQLFPGEDAKVVATEIAALDPRVWVIESDDRFVVARVPGSVRTQISRIQAVEHIDVSQTFDPLWIDLGPLEQPTTLNALDGSESGTRAMGYDAAWNTGLTGRGQVASMADTGLDTGDLNSLAVDFKPAVTTGHHFGLFAKSWEDPMGHGTHVAGSIAGRGTASGGALRGGAFEAGLVPQSMWSPMLNNLSVPTKLGDMFGRAQSEGARVHSNSWGSPRNLGAYDAFAQQVDEWTFANPETLVIFAAGNSGVDKNKDGRIDPGSIGSPGTAKNALTVGASENVTKTGGIQVPVSRLRAAADSWPAEPIFSSLISDNVNGLAMFSSRGPTSDQRIKPDVVAPGTNVLSARSHHSTAQDLWGRHDDNYVWSGGTSMAAPLVAGAAVLVRQALIEKHSVSRPSAALLKAVLMHTATDMYPGQYGAVGAARGQELLTPRPNSDQGYGRVDMNTIAGMDGRTVFVDDQGVATGGDWSAEINVSQAGSLLANLVYTDAAASANAAAALVNDLDLILIDAQGQEFKSADRVNNHEVLQKVLQPGRYRLVVRGHRVAQGQSGKQPFALVYSLK